MALYFLSSTMLCSLWRELFPNLYLLSFLCIYQSPILRVTPRRLSIHSIHSQNTCILWTNTYILTIHTFSQYICSLSTYMLSKHTFSQYLHSLNTVWVNLKVPEFLVIVRERVHLSAPVQTSDCLGCRASCPGNLTEASFCFSACIVLCKLIEDGIVLSQTSHLKPLSASLSQCHITEQ